MHSSRMRTVRCSNRLPGGGACPGGGIHLHLLPVDRQSPVKTTFLQLLLRTVIRKNSVEFLFMKNVIEIFSSETFECFQV